VVAEVIAEAVAEVVVMEVMEVAEAVVVPRLLTADAQTRGRQSARVHVANGWLEKAASADRCLIKKTVHGRSLSQTCKAIPRCSLEF